MSAVVAGGGRPTGRGVRGIACVLAGLALGLASYGLVRHNNWYLASDQAAFLTMARDFRSGTVFHATEIFAEVAPKQRPGKTYDVLQQTYFLRDGQMYSRYPPGFPLLLAGAGLVAGEAGEHALNPVLYLGVLLVLASMLRALLRKVDDLLAWGSAVLVLWLVLLVPTGVHLWGITVARDLPAHGFGLMAVFLAFRRQPVLSGLCLGGAALMRPDALIYAVSILALAALRRPSLREAAAWSVAIAVGMLPLFAYNTMTQGGPLSFTQGGEFREVFGWLAPATAHAAVSGTVGISGGGFRLSHLATTLPGNLRLLLDAFGPLLLCGVLAAGWSLRRRPEVVAALGTYPLAALLFYSCWVHPDARYLTGAYLCLLGLCALGGALWVRFFCRLPGSSGFVWATLLAALLGSWQQAGVSVGPLPAPSAVLVVLALAAAVASFCERRRVGLGPISAFAPAIGLAALALLPMLGGAPRWGLFQKEQKLAAQAFVADRIPAGSLVFASPLLGRPVENLRIYAGAEAFYPAEFALLDTSAEAAARRSLRRGRRVFWLGDRRVMPPSLPGVGQAQLVSMLPSERAMELFVDPRRAPAGVWLYEWISPAGALSH